MQVCICHFYPYIYSPSGNNKKIIKIEKGEKNVIRVENKIILIMLL